MIDRPPQAVWTLSQGAASATKRVACSLPDAATRTLDCRVTSGRCGRTLGPEPHRVVEDPV